MTEEMRVLEIVREEVRESVRPVLLDIKGSVERYGGRLDEIASGLAAAALERTALAGRATRLEERSTEDRARLGSLEERVGRMGVEVTGISARAAIIGGIVLSVVSAVLGAVAMRLL